MNERSKFQLIVAILVALAILGYAGYFVRSEIILAKSSYIEKRKELISLERKQEQLTQLEEELNAISENKSEIIGALLSKEDTLRVIERIEEVARREGLSHEVKILGEVTRESIERELALIHRSRGRADKEVLEEISNKLPSISFQVKLKGGYSGIIRFFEGVATLPYYTKIESFNISSGKVPTSGNEEPPVLDAIVNLIIFMR